MGSRAFGGIDPRVIYRGHQTRDAGGAELEQPTGATPNAIAINRRMFWDSE
jgi:hypothetical protein